MAARTPPPAALARMAELYDHMAAALEHERGVGPGELDPALYGGLAIRVYDHVKAEAVLARQRRK